ncbi:MAG: flagellar biosynthesis anti-sigma factor FlgM [Methylophaga sp.]|nr:flagellar biosynthesis anti-sigma factor FlgM [Methylophaga sp.]
MSEINNIKNAGQSGLNSTRNVSARENSGSDKAADVQSSANPVRTDTVSLTDTATQLRSLQQTLSDTPVVNNERVEALRAAIADGSYQVDATELAQNMINFESQLR